MIDDTIFYCDRAIEFRSLSHKIKCGQSLSKSTYQCNCFGVSAPIGDRLPRIVAQCNHQIVEVINLRIIAVTVPRFLSWHGSPLSGHGLSATLWWSNLNSGCGHTIEYFDHDNTIPLSSTHGTLRGNFMARHNGKGSEVIVPQFLQGQVPNPISN